MAVPDPKVKVCRKCGNLGFAKDLVTCNLCKDTHEHIYCMKKLLHKIPAVWSCEVCVPAKKVSTSLSQRKGVKRSSILLEKLPGEQHTPVKSRRTSFHRPFKQGGGSKEQSREIRHEHPGGCSSRHLSGTRGMLQPLIAGVEHDLPSPAQESVCARIAPNNKVGEKASDLPNMQERSNLNTCAAVDAFLHASGGPHALGMGHTVKNQTTQNLSPISNPCGGMPSDAQHSKSRLPKTSSSIAILPNTLPHQPISDANCNAGLEHDLPSVAQLSVSARIAQNNKVGEKASGPSKQESLNLNARAAVEASLHASGGPHALDMGHTVQNLTTQNLSLIRNPRDSMLTDTQHNRSRLISPNTLPHQPISDANWKGCFEIYDAVSCVIHGTQGIEAHIPGEVSVQVYETLKKLPRIIKLKLRRSKNVWPYADRPNVDDIGSFFLPLGNKPRRKETYTRFLDLMDERDMAMQGWISEDTQLLVFSSRKLPQDSVPMTGLAEGRFMWGVFRQLKIKEKILDSSTEPVETVPAVPDIPPGFLRPEARTVGPAILPGVSSREARIDVPDISPGFPSRQARLGVPVIPPGVPSCEARTDIPDTQPGFPSRETRKNVSGTLPNLPSHEARTDVPHILPCSPKREELIDVPDIPPGFPSREARTGVPGILPYFPSCEARTVVRGILPGVPSHEARTNVPNTPPGFPSCERRTNVPNILPGSPKRKARPAVPDIPPGSSKTETWTGVPHIPPVFPECKATTNVPDILPGFQARTAFPSIPPGFEQVVSQTTMSTVKEEKG